VYPFVGASGAGRIEGDEAVAAVTLSGAGEPTRAIAGRQVGLLALSMTALAVLTRAPGLLSARMYDVDESYLAAMGSTMGRGGHLYVDAVDRKPPLLPWLYSLPQSLFGSEDLRLNALDLAPVHFSNVALAFAAPVFNAGRIDAGIRVQSARAEEALLSWQKAVLVAVQEVEDSLLVRAQEAERTAALTSTVDNRRRSLQRAQSLQREGQIDLLVLLDVQRSVLSSELALSDSRLQQVLADVQLYKALGGGFAPAHVSGITTSLAQRTPQ